MPIQNNFALPASAQELPLPEAAGSKIFVTFNASADPSTGQPWCPDVRVAIPVLEAAFTTTDSHTLLVEEVGQRPGWKDPQNIYRTKWNVHATPTLVRFERIDGKVVETGRLVEGEILDKLKLESLIA